MSEAINKIELIYTDCYTSLGLWNAHVAEEQFVLCIFLPGTINNTQWLKLADTYMYEMSESFNNTATQTQVIQKKSFH